MRERVVAACLAAVLVAGLVGVAVHEDPAATTVTIAAPPESEADFDSDDTTTTSAAPTTTAAAPAPTPTTVRKPVAKRAAAAPKPKPAPANGLYGPTPPGNGTFAFDAGRTSWTHVQSGVTMTLTVDRQSAGWGEPFTFTMTATSDRSCCGVALLYGDGSKFDRQPPEPCGGSPGTGGTRTFTATKYYPKPGRWQFSFQAYTGNCNTDFHDYAGFTGWINVLDGPPASNGPAAPEVFWTYEQGPEQYQDGKRRIGIEVWARDADGHIRDFVVDWGDGSPVQQVAGDPRPCQNGANGWPPGNEYTISPNPEHWFAQGAAVNGIKITVTSRGCDGAAVQTGVSSFPSPPRSS